METNTMDNKTMELRITVGHVIELLRSAFHFVPVTDTVKILAFLLYLRQNDSLQIKSTKDVTKDEIVLCFWINNCLTCPKALITTHNQEFNDLLVGVLQQISDAFEKQYIFEVASIINGWDLSKSDALSLIDYVVLANNRRSSGIVFPTHDLSLIIANLMENNAQWVFDPFGGLMDFATTMTTDNRHFVVNESYGPIRELGLFRLALAGILEDTTINTNSIEEWTDQVFDAIVTFPRFSLLMNMKDFNAPGETEKAELVAIRRFEKTTTRNGQLITMIPASFLFSERNSDKELRKIITHNNWLDSIIYLPSAIFTKTSLSFVLIVLRKQRTHDTVRMLDASKCDVKELLNYIKNPTFIKQLADDNYIEVTTKDVIKEDASWNIRWYMDNRKEDFSNGYTIVECAEILRPAISSRGFDDIKGRVVNVSSLSSVFYQYEKSAEMFLESDNLTGTLKVTEPVLLISLLGKPKPTYCQASEQAPIFIKSNVCAFKLTNETVHPGYLCMELAQRLKDFQGVATIPRITKMQILHTRVGFPTLNQQRSLIEQKNLFDEACKAEQMILLKEQGMENIVETLKDDYLKNIHARKHAMMQNTSTLALAWDSLLRYLENNNGKFDMNDVINRKHPVKVEELVRSIATNIKTIDHQAKHLTEVERYWGEPEQFRIQDFISKYIKEHQSTMFRYEFEYNNDVSIGYYNNDGDYEDEQTESTWMVEMPQNALCQVIDNIVSNAVSHGFTEHKKDYCVRFECYYDKDNVVLEISNNGEPMHEEINTEWVKTYGRSTRLNEQIETDGKVHSGIGGYDIYNILKKYNAEFDVVSSPNHEFTVSYIITFHNIVNK